MREKLVQVGAEKGKLEEGSWEIEDLNAVVEEPDSQYGNPQFKFEKLVIWQKAMKFGEDIYQISSSFPKHETYNLTSQIRRAVDSIALNISEGSIEQSKPEFRRFLSYSIRSIAEVVTCLHKAKARECIIEESFTKNYNFAFHLMNMAIGFKNKLK